MSTLMPSTDDIKSRAARAYNAAFDTYDNSSLSFWARFGSRTVGRLNLDSGKRVLDVCCGSGASALIAAEAVGPTRHARGRCELWRMVRPGGKLAITTWGPDLFEPANTLFWESIRRVRPDLHKAFNPWDQINTVESLRSLLARGGVDQADVEAEAGQHRLRRPEDRWEIVMGSGYRGIVDRLTEVERRQVESAVVSQVRAAKTVEINTPVFYAVATKP